jgi:hypothetical protein
MTTAFRPLVPARREADRPNPAARVQRGDGHRTMRGREAAHGAMVAGGRKANMGREAI